MRPSPGADRRGHWRIAWLAAAAIALGGAQAAPAQSGPTSATKPTERSAAPTVPTTEAGHSPPPFSVVVPVPGAQQGRLGPIVARRSSEPLSPWAMVPASDTLGGMLLARGPAQPLGGLAARLALFELFGPARGIDLERVAFAVDGAESSHGADTRMWRPAPSGPQGPMQVSLAAAIDVGGGNRFDEIENRILGRAYLAHLYRRYGNWPDAIAAYNWGPGNLESWILAGRPVAGLPLGVERYLDRVLRDASLGAAGAVSMAPASLALGLRFRQNSLTSAALANYLAFQNKPGVNQRTP
jgi:hypothetical protein